MADLSATEGSNQPTNSTSIGANLDDNLRMVGALLAALRDASGWGGLKLTSVAGTNTVTGSVAAQGSITMAPTAYASGMRFHFVPANANTGAATLNVNSLGAKNIFLNGAALVGYELLTRSPVIVEYDGTQFNVVGGAYGGDGIPVGKVDDFAGTTAPNSHLFCYGQAISRTTYADLFAVIGTTYGAGDESTTFNVPDIRGRVVAGQDDMGGSSANRLTDQTGGLDGDTLGDTGGAETHILTTAQLPTNRYLTGSETDGTNDGSGVVGGTGSTTGSGAAHNNVQPTIILNKVIKF